MSKVHVCVNELKAFFIAVFADKWDEAGRIQQQIVLYEHEADEIKHELHTHLPSSLFMPVSRSDLLELLNVQDRLANKAKDIAGVVLGRKMHFPEPILVRFLDFLNRTVDACKQANVAIHELDELLETSFSGNEIKLVDKMIATLNQIENETDSQQIHLRQQLFNLEKEYPPVDVIFLYKIIEWVGELADLSREVGDRLQILLAR